MTAPGLPAVFGRLDTRDYEIVYVGSSTLFGETRPWRISCRACGKVFHPLATELAVTAIEYHNAIVDKQPARCRRPR
jgi:hypothetical protein